MPIVWPAGNDNTRNAIAPAAAVKKATYGEVVITVHPGGLPGIRGTDGMAAVRDGLGPIAEILLSRQVGAAPILGLETRPFSAPGSPGRAILREHGMTVTRPSAELPAELLKTAMPLWDAFKTRLPGSAPVIDADPAIRK